VKTGLIVDDAAIMRMRLREILQGSFNIVGEACDGEEALALYNQLKPDFVTLDISMPRTNGLDALKKLIASHPDAKVVIVSAVGQKRMVIEALALGAADFVIKPFEPERVLKAITRLMNGR
jgi:two-component system chemotaxis response regulator CheY